MRVQCPTITLCQAVCSSTIVLVGVIALMKTISGTWKLGEVVEGPKVRSLWPPIWAVCLSERIDFGVGRQVGNEVV